ncbi:hypothetical protein J3459_017817 [Metarhizium acridum]|uniref:uncharacterized protein n=1 Tax=Metarhizium acridum TaxID=92637 RepID=UPI001C6C1D85|nr:hypothetical protein J3459_017817 [Metarhizium acridum]KAG8410393.1 hypothetical protein J3458_017717 [Metarhizium acridum]
MSMRIAGVRPVRSAKKFHWRLAQQPRHTYGSMRMSASFRQVEHTISGSHTREYLGATANGDDDVPQLAVKQYIPLNNPRPQPGDVTIIGAHANGFPKVSPLPAFGLWPEDPNSQELTISAGVVRASLGRCVRSAVVEEHPHQVDLDRGHMEPRPVRASWFDHARDLMNLINSKQDDIRHAIAGIRHSMGGTQL